MRKPSHLFLTVVALLATALWAGTAQAGIPGSAHETTAGTAGACSACHIPHGGGANRLWPAAPGTVTSVGVVAPLCATCHSTTGGYAGSMGNAASDAYVYHANSHGQLMGITNLPWNTNVTNSGLPYATQAVNFECTTCHDVHNDPAATTPSGNRPFLRASLNNLCQKCHLQRHFVSGTTAQNQLTGAWGGNSFVGPLNPGSHPVGSDITAADNFGGGSNIVVAVQMRVLANNTGAGGWSLGGHLTANTGGGVTCVSCHAVHGDQIDAQDNTAGQVAFTAASPNTNYLALPQASISAAWTNNRSVANGNGGYNALCEGCHGGGADPPGYAGTYNPNPGAVGTYSHPIDDYPATYNAGVTAFPALWPVGGGMTAGANVAPIPICESCHAPHVIAERTATTPRTDVSATAAAYILRDGVVTFCANCHTGTIAGHHPVGMAYNVSGVSYLRNIGTGTQTLTCATCHNGSGGAHNWTAAGLIALDNNWKPLNNGRSTTQATDMYNADMSKTCMDCHYSMDGNAASVSPTLGTGATAAVGLEPAFNTLNTSMGTHYIGLMHTASTTWRNAPLVANIQSTTTTWRASLGGSLLAGLGWSRFGGDAANPVLVCESCHELEPDKNVGAGANQHLLLARYGEGNNGNDGSGDTATGRDLLCEACHGVPTGTHALTGQIVSRTGVALNTTASWLRGTVLGYATVGANVLSCDGCHQPHDANTASYTFILDAPATVTFPSAGLQTTVGAGTIDAAQPEATTAYPTATGAANTYATPTLAGRGGSFTGFCDQCHTYAY